MSVKLKHTQLQDVNFVVVDVGRPYELPYDCPNCSKPDQVITHTHKAYHLRLNSHGEVTVSDEIYDRLAEIPGLPLTKVGKDNNPQPQVLMMGNEVLEVPTQLEEPVKWALHAKDLPVVGPRQER